MTAKYRMYLQGNGQPRIPLTFLAATILARYEMSDHSVRAYTYVHVAEIF